MKKLLILLTFLGLGVFISCSKDATTTTSTDALTITADAFTHYEGESFKFTVRSSDGADVSSKATIQVEGVQQTGNSFYSITDGTFTVTATYNGATTKPIQVTVTANPVALTSITLTPSSTIVVTGDVVTFNVVGNNNSKLTQACVIYVNGTKINGNTYTATTAGDLTVTATYPSATPVSTTAPVTVTVGQAVSFTKRVLIEDYTGAWCGWCPRVVKAIESVEGKTSMVVPVAIHVSGGSTATDPFNTPIGQSLAQSFGVTSFPNAKLNRTTTWKSSEVENVQQVIDLVNNGANPRVGLAMNTSLNGTTATVNVKVKFGQNFSNLKIVVYALEDKLAGDQHDYTTYYGGSGNQIIPNFAYDNVFRGVLTSALGDAITESTTLNAEITRSYTYTVPSTVNAANLHFVAFVVDGSKNALNVRNAKSTETQDYEVIQ